jgi:outer membrane protein assembly factor BamB
MSRVLVAVVFFSLLPSLVLADGWPQYRGDAARSGYTGQQLPDRLVEDWVYSSSQAPDPAWQGVDTRMPFDHAFQPVADHGSVYFGSSADCRVYSLDSGTGEQRWSFTTGAPVRFAPALWKGRVFVVSDDGWLYCLSAVNGSVVWKEQGGPDGQMILGNDRMVSRWPARGGAVVDRDVVYFAAGIWPTDGVYIKALDAASGREVWSNSTSGSIEMDKPHPGARAKSGVAAQGYLAVVGEKLIVPTGRSVPAVFDKNDGTLLYFHQQTSRSYGGSRVVGAGEYFLVDSGNERGTSSSAGHSKVIFVAGSGELATESSIPSVALACSGSFLYYAGRGGINGLKLADMFASRQSKGQNDNAVTRTVLKKPAEIIAAPGLDNAVTMAVAGDRVIVGTADGNVVVKNVGGGGESWSGRVDGRAMGLAVADGRLFVATDKGTIHCFSAQAGAQTKRVYARQANEPYGDNKKYREAATAIVSATGVTSGFCADINCGDGRLAYELARMTDLNIYAVDPDPANVERARQMLQAAGLYGSRVTVHLADPSATDYPDYFSDLTVSGRSAAGELPDESGQREMLRITRPYGGVLCTGEAESLTTAARGELEGADPGWTHLYHDPANTLTSSDQRVNGPLSMLWFRDSDQEMPSRHGRGVGPLFYRGLMFVQGLGSLRAVNAYNGRTVWERPLTDVMKAYDQEHLVGAAATGGNICLEDGRLYVRSPGRLTDGDFSGKSCLVLDCATGEQLDEYRIPGAEQGDDYWGYLAVEDGILYGSVADPGHVLEYSYRESDMTRLFSESKRLFALDAGSGELKWDYTAQNSIRHNAIAIGGGKLYLIDRAVAVSDAIRRNPHRAGKGEAQNPVQPPGLLVALDASSGKELWRNSDKIFGTMLALSVKHDVLLMSYQFTRFRQDSESGGTMRAIRASSGEKLWESATGLPPVKGYNYASRPLLVDRTIYLEPGAWDLLSGSRLEFAFDRSYACGIMTGCSNMLLYRSATVGYYDLNSKQGTENFGGIRPGCWINALPVGGLVLMPDATARCNCGYLIKANVALIANSRRSQ